MDMTNQQDADMSDDDAFAAGFASVQGEATPAPVARESEPEEVAEAPAAEAEPNRQEVRPEQDDNAEQATGEQPADQDDPFAGLHPKVREMLAKTTSVDQALQRLSRMEGSIGGLQSYVKQLGKPQAQPASDPAAAPVAGLSGEKLAKVREDFPELADAFEDFARQMARPAAGNVPDVVALTNEVRESVRREMQYELIGERHPDWQQSLRSADAQLWMQTLPDDELQEFRNSESAAVVVRYLDKFAEYKSRQQQAASVQQRRESVARSAVTPQGGAKAGGARRHEPSEDDAFDAGFASVRGTRIGR
jgi:hypothetical protein